MLRSFSSSQKSPAQALKLFLDAAAASADGDAQLFSFSKYGMTAVEVLVESVLRLFVLTFPGVLFWILSGKDTKAGY